VECDDDDDGDDDNGATTPSSDASVVALSLPFHALLLCLRVVVFAKRLQKAALFRFQVRSSCPVMHSRTVPQHFASSWPR
jgi:hypothetical protein